MPRVVHTRPGVWPAVKPGRFAAHIQREHSEGCRVALLGLPDDTGVRLNGGRPGAAAGPAAFRAALAAFGVSHDGATGASLDIGVYDAGDVEPAAGTGEDALFEMHARVEAAAAELHARGLTPVGIGGGHDLSLPAIAAFARAARRPLGGVNVDAHLDVRARVGSGMPFRRLIEQGHLDARRFVEVGLGRFSNDAGDLAWLRERGATLSGVEDALDRRPGAQALLEIALGGGTGFVSIDLDVLDSSAAPGVSAHNPLGLGVRHAAEFAESAGADARVGHFDLMELAPAYDLGGRTARAAAYLFLAFIAGFARRA
jgi:formiminoglutamase